MKAVNLSLIFRNANLFKNAQKSATAKTCYSIFALPFMLHCSEMLLDLPCSGGDV